LDHLHRHPSPSLTSTTQSPLESGATRTRSGDGRAPGPAVHRSVRRSLWPSAGEWVLFGYLAVVCVLTILQRTGDVDLRLLASTPDDVASARVWTLVLSGLVAAGPLVVQVAEIAVLGVLAIRLAGARVFWTAAIVAHLFGTMAVYAGVWIAAAVMAPSSLSTELDYGISLVWCAALGVLAGTAWWGRPPLHRRTRLVLAVAPALYMVVFVLDSDGLAQYEHAVAFVLATVVVLVTRSWPRSWGERSRTSVSAGRPR
jgi:hypothetical protein